MVKVITYGTYDCLHYGPIRLLQRAKALGDYLIVGVTSEDFDINRGKINVKQSLVERIEAVRKTGLADKIIIEEYQGQKIDDIQRYDVDYFAVGSDWEGYFDYLKEYCQVVYLPRTDGISSTELRTAEMHLRMGIVGESKAVVAKFVREGKYVNGLEFYGICSQELTDLPDYLQALPLHTQDYQELLEHVDAVYICTHPRKHYDLAREALSRGKHVICESPLLTNRSQCEELFHMAESRGLILMEAIKTAYSLAFNRMIVLIKSGLIGDVVSVDATCTSLARDKDMVTWGGMYGWSPQALLAIFMILGVHYRTEQIVTQPISSEETDAFTKIDFIYDQAVASLKVGIGVKSEGELVVSGTKGYIYVPAPWWKTDYFEARYEDQRENKKFFYQLKGEGIRNMIVHFVQSVSSGKEQNSIPRYVSCQIAEVMESFQCKCNMVEIARKGE